MRERPLSVTIIGWFLVVVGVLSLLNLPITLNNPTARDLMESSVMGFAGQLAINVASSLVTIVCGVFILKARDWARLLYVGWNIALLVFSLFTGPFKSLTLLSVIFLAVVAFFLFRGPANLFFGKNWFDARDATTRG